MGRFVDPFEEFRRKKEMEKLQGEVIKKRKKRDRTERKDSFDGFHISSFFKDARRKKPGGDK